MQFTSIPVTDFSVQDSASTNSFSGPKFTVVDVLLYTTRPLREQKKLANPFYSYRAIHSLKYSHK